MANVWEVASGEDSITCLKALLQTTSVDIQDGNGYTPLHAASSYNNLEAIVLLVEMGANVDIQDCDGDTPLHFSEVTEVSQLLIQLGANPLSRNHAGYLPVETAYMEGREGVVSLLAQFSPDFRRIELTDELHLDLEDADHTSVDVFELARSHGINLTIIDEGQQENQEDVER